MCITISEELSNPDGQVRWNYYQNKLVDTSNGLFGQKLDTRGLSINGNIGYNYGFSGNWFIEPFAGFLWSKVSVDPLNTSGTFALAQIPGSAPPGTVFINNIYSALGRVSLQVGTSISTSDWILQPFATISGFREFQGNNSATLATQFPQVGVNGFLGGISPPPTSGTMANSALASWPSSRTRDGSPMFAPTTGPARRSPAGA